MRFWHFFPGCLPSKGSVCASSLLEPRRRYSEHELVRVLYDGAGCEIQQRGRLRRRGWPDDAASCQCCGTRCDVSCDSVCDGVVCDAMAGETMARYLMALDAMVWDAVSRGIVAWDAVVCDTMVCDTVVCDTMV